MSPEWRTQRARRVRASAMLAMHVLTSSIQPLLCFSVLSLTLPFSPQSEKKGLVRACVRRDVKLGLLKMLGSVSCCVCAVHPVLFSFR